AGQDQKIPMAFLYGKDNKSDADAALQFVKYIRPKYERGKAPDDDLKGTGEQGFKSKLVGAKLLNDQLGTNNWIWKGYLDSKALQDTRGTQWEKGETETFPSAGWGMGGRPTPAKGLEEKQMNPIPVPAFMR